MLEMSAGGLGLTYATGFARVPCPRRGRRPLRLAQAVLVRDAPSAPAMFLTRGAPHKRDTRNVQRSNDLHDAEVSHVVENQQ